MIKISSWLLGSKPKFYPIGTHPLVPVMTSGAQNGFIISSSSFYASGIEAWRSFSGSGIFHSADEGSNHVWINVELAHAEPLINIFIRNGETWYYDSVEIKASNDGVNFNTLFTSPASGPNVNYEYFINNTNPYKHYRMYFISARPLIQLGQIQLYK